MLQNLTRKIHLLLRRFSAGAIFVFTAAACLSNCAHPEGKQSSEKNTGENETKAEETARPVVVVKAQSMRLRNKIDVPGELLAFQDVPIHAKVQGYISSIAVDRGSWVHKGQKLISIYCPELIEKINEAEAKVSAAEATVSQAKSAWENSKAQLQEVRSKLDSDRLTFTRLQEAARTPGAVPENEVVVADKTVQADEGRLAAVQASIKAAYAVVEAEQRNVTAATSVLNSLKAMRSYLTIEAPFDGVISSRNVHEGSIVAVSHGRDAEPLIRIQQESPLRLVAAIPEDAVGSLHLHKEVEFSVPAFPGRKFVGTVDRPAFALDLKTRTMPVELTVKNQPRVLSPGMYCNVDWIVSRPYKTVFLPSSAVGTDLVGSFVNKISSNILERVPVKKGDQMGDMIEVSGNIKDGDEVALKASKEFKNGAHVTSRLAESQPLTSRQRESESSELE